MCTCVCVCVCLCEENIPEIDLLGSGISGPFSSTYTFYIPPFPTKLLLLIIPHDSRLFPPSTSTSTSTMFAATILPRKTRRTDDGTEGSRANRTKNISFPVFFFRSRKKNIYICIIGKKEPS